MTAAEQATRPANRRHRDLKLVADDVPPTEDPSADSRPTVPVILGELATAVAVCNRLLAERSAATFVLGDVLVTLENVGGGIQTLRATPVRISLELSRVARFEKIHRVTDKGPEWGRCDPPMKLADAIASEPGGWLAPRLGGLTEVPILRPDGDVVTRPGYDPVSGLYLHGGPFEPVGDDPTYALDVLLDAISEFKFVDDRHRSGALALLLTATCRRALPSAPLFAISAHEASSGKGTLATLAAILATGRRGAEQPWPSGIPEEERKAITSALLLGQSLLILDNLTEPLESSALCVLLTAERWSDRLLGGNRLVQLPASLLLIATGNNLTIVGDLCRRVLPIQMDVAVENPELREFSRELVPWAIENRPALVNAALTILACYRRAGAPLPAGFKPLGSFEAWSRLVCGSLVWLGQLDPRDTMADNRANDPKRLILASVLTGMHALFGERDAQGNPPWQTAASIFNAAKNAEPDKAQELRDALEVITLKARDEKASRIVFGRWLEEHKGKIVGGLRLEGERDSHRKVNTWWAKPCG